MTPRLLLFDVDGTLLQSDGAGYRAVARAGEEVFGARPSGKPRSYAGRLDPDIYRELCAALGVEDPARHHDRFRERYRLALAEELETTGAARSLPGVPRLLDALEGLEHLTLGILSGNYPETGRAKLTAAGLVPERFRVQAWGTDGEERHHLPAVALERFAAHPGIASTLELTPERVVVIGDTPRDVDCARRNGCRSIAVATGTIAYEDLAAAGADHTLRDLSDTEGFLRLLD